MNLIRDALLILFWDLFGEITVIETPRWDLLLKIPQKHPNYTRNISRDSFSVARISSRIFAEISPEILPTIFHLYSFYKSHGAYLMCWLKFVNFTPST